MINLSLNNETVELQTGTSLAQALETWGYTGNRIAVAINGEFVPRASYHERELEDGDALDIVKPVGGG